jgi:outer membrane protein
MKLLSKLIFILINYLIVPVIYAENLMDIYNLAKDNDQILQAAYQEHRSQLEALPQARAVLLPTIATNADSSKYDYEFSNSVLKFNTWSYGLKLTQPVFRMDYWNKLSQAKEQTKMAFANLADAEQTLLLRVAKQYFDVLKAEDDLCFSKIEQDSNAKHLEQTKQRYKVGLTAITDVHEAQARYDSSFAKVIAAENTLENSHEQLRVITGKNIAKLATLKEKIGLPTPEPANTEKWVLMATEKNWKLQAARYNLVISRQKIQEERSGYYPNVQIESNIGKQKNESPTIPGTSTSRNVALTLSLPLFNGGLTYSKTRQARYNYEKASRNLEAQYRNIECITRQSYNNVATMLSKIKALKQAIVSNTSALKATQAAYEVGNRTIVDVLDSQSALIKVEKDYSEARYDYIIQSLTLKQTAGTLSVEDLQQINAWLLS